MEILSYFGDFFAKYAYFNSGDSVIQIGIKIWDGSDETYLITGLLATETNNNNNFLKKPGEFDFWKIWRVDPNASL